MILRELINKFGFEIDDDALKKADKRLAAFKKTMVSIGDSATDFGKKLSVRVTLPIIGLGAALIKTASDAEETEAKFDTVFGGIQERANQTSRDLARGFGLSSTKAKELLGNTGNLLTGFGFTQESALDLSKQVTELAVDLASFTNFAGGAEGASSALTKALLGEREAAKGLGLAIQEEDVKRQVQENRIKGLTFATDRQAKAYATLQIAQRLSKNAIGDFARTSQGVANQFRILQGETNDVAVSFGKLLLPIALKLIRAVRSLLQFLEGLSDEMKTAILIGGAFAAALGPALIIVGQMASGIGVLLPLMVKLATGIKFIGNASLFAQAKLLLIPLAIAAVIAAIVLIGEDIAAFVQGRDSVIGRLFIGLDQAFTLLAAKFQDLGIIARTLIAIILTPFRAMTQVIKTAASAIDVLRGKMGVGDFGKALLSNMAQVSPFSDAATGSLGGAIGLSPGATSPLGALASRAQEAVGKNVAVTQEAKLNVNVQGLPPEAAKQVAQASLTDAMGAILRETTRAARPAIER